jgi:hypothetical protein
MAGKDPAALLYIDKWIAATQGMRGDEKGWFLELILYQFDKGSLPSDIDELASICRIRPSEFDKFKQVFEQVLKQKFEQDDNGRLENGFAKEIIQGRQAFKAKRSHSGKWSYAKKYIIKNYGDKSQEEWHFIYEQFDFSIDLKNEQVFKQMLEHIFELYINANVDVNEDEFRIEFKEGPGEQTAHTVTVEVPRGTVSREEMTDEWFLQFFDEKYMADLIFPYRGVDLKSELEKFKVRVRGDPNEYGSRDTGGIRSAFLYQLDKIRPGGPPKRVSEDRMEKFRNMKP